MNSWLNSLELPAALVAVSSPTAIDCKVDAEVDARGLVCPLPLLKAKQALRNLPTDALLRVLATDAASLRDFVSFAQLAAQPIVGFYWQDNLLCYLIRKS